MEYERKEEIEFEEVYYFFFCERSRQTIWKDNDKNPNQHEFDSIAQKRAIFGCYY